MASPSEARRRILLVEDDPDIRSMYNLLFSKAGCDMTLAKDGVEAWDILTSHDPFDVVLLDIVLPKKDGFELLKDIRKHSHLHSQKVVLLTNLAQEVDRKEGERLGATQYIVKAHIDPKDLLKQVAECI